MSEVQKIELFERIYEGYNTEVTNLGSMLWTIRIESYLTPAGGGQCVERVWSNLPFNLVTKYNWYFRVRAARIQIAKPKKCIGIVFVRQTPNEESYKQMLTHLHNRLKAQNGKVTQVKNAISKMSASWKELFPIEESPIWQKLWDKLKTHEAIIADLEEQISEQNKNPKRNHLII